MTNPTSTNEVWAPKRARPDVLRRQIHRRRVLAGMGLTAAAVGIGDQLWGAIEAARLPRAEARMLLNPGSNTLVHIFGGLATPGSSIEQVPARPIVENVNKASAIAYGYSGIRHQETMALAMDAQNQMRPERTVIISQSLGLMPALDLATRVQATGGRVDMLVADSGCTPGAARPGFNAALKIDGNANLVTRSGILNCLKPGYVRDNLVPPLDQRQADLITEEQFYDYREGIINAPLWVIGLQGDFLAGCQVEQDALEGVADRVMYFRTRRPDLDTFVDPLAAIPELQGWLGNQQLEVVVDLTRRDDNHTATGYPRSLVELVGEVAATA